MEMRERWRPRRKCMRRRCTRKRRWGRGQLATRRWRLRWLRLMEAMWRVGMVRCQWRMAPSPRTQDKSRCPRLSRLRLWRPTPSRVLQTPSIQRHQLLQPTPGPARKIPPTLKPTTTTLTGSSSPSRQSSCTRRRARARSSRRQSTRSAKANSPTSPSCFSGARIWPTKASTFCFSTSAPSWPRREASRRASF